MNKVSSKPIDQRYQTTEAVFTYGAVDNDGNPHPVFRHYPPLLTPARAHLKLTGKFVSGLPGS